MEFANFRTAKITDGPAEALDSTYQREVLVSAKLSKQECGKMVAEYAHCTIILF